MRVDAFDFDLPAARIADRPASPRDAARLLEVGRDTLVDRGVRDLPALVRPGDVMVFNDTRVLPARLLGLRGAVKVELLLHRALAADRWLAFARPAKRLKTGHVIAFDDGLAAEVRARTDDGLVEVAFNRAAVELAATLARIGHVPLPPYIDRPDDARDRSDYQTVYARNDGAVAAPTAGLHFTPALLAALDAAGVKRVHATLHVGAGTFLPVKATDTVDHRMHAEWGTLSAEAAAAIMAARAAGGRVIAVGTTSLRLLESAATARGELAPFTGDTALFITPGYRFKMVDVLMTNFHLPRSTLFMLVAARAGRARRQRPNPPANAPPKRLNSHRHPRRIPPAAGAPGAR
ncbi:MAG: tRNA preQ1(34) S-adenosylmethionine ribosyltransferase-isomerase QueA, partial [Rhodospirillaceae bacterium]|nr:tRNA preQ1(34) S-adenosylmethionine ribosyltransferase-isomerase QueA [Rhodospirillaceae bacterium]